MHNTLFDTMLSSYTVHFSPHICTVKSKIFNKPNKKCTQTRTENRAWILVLKLEVISIRLVYSCLSRKAQRMDSLSALPLHNPASTSVTALPSPSLSHLCWRNWTAAQMWKAELINRIYFSSLLKEHRSFTAEQLWNRSFNFF